MSDGKITYDVVANTSGYDSDLDKAHSKAASGFKTVRNGGVAAFAAVGAAVAATAAGMVKLTQQGVAWNAQMEQYQMAFTTLLGDAEAAADAITRIKADAAATPFDVDSLVSANQLLIGAGVSAEDSRDAIMALGDAVAATGGGSAELQRMAANLQQIKNLGVASSMDIKQFAMAGINIYAVMADYMGISTEEAANMKITYEDLTAALEHASAEGGMYFGAMAGQSQTFNGMISTLKDNWAQLVGSITAGVASILSEGVLPKVIEWVQRLQAAFNEGGFDGLLDEATRVLGELLMAVVDAAPKIATAVLEVLKGIVKVLNENSEQIMEAVFAILEAVLKALLDAVPVILETVMLMLNAIFAKLCEYIAIFAGVAWDWIKEMAGMIADKAGELWQAVKDAVQGALQMVKDKIEDFKNVGKDLIEGIWNGINDKVEWLKGKVRGVVDKIKSWFTGSEGFDEHSPSKYFRVVGEFVDEGLAEGLDRASHIPETAVRRVVADVKEAAEIDLAAPYLGGRAGDISGAVSALLAAKTGATKVSIEFNGDLAALTRLLYPEIKVEELRYGDNLVKGGAA